MVEWPAIWSAIAASFSAGAAVLMLRFHHVNRRDSVRPELVIDDFALVPRVYTGERPTLGAVVFGLKNVGVGAAFNTRTAGDVHSYGGKPDSANPMTRLRPLLPSGETLDGKDVIEFFWPLNSDREFTVRLNISYEDLYHRVYQTSYVFAIDSFSHKNVLKTNHTIDIISRKTVLLRRLNTAKHVGNRDAAGMKSPLVEWADYISLAGANADPDKRVEKK